MTVSVYCIIQGSSGTTAVQCKAVAAKHIIYLVLVAY